MLDIFIGSDNVLELNGLRDVTAAVGTFINDASSVMYRILDSSGAEVVAATAMAYVAASDGIYRGTIQDTLVMAEAEHVNVEVIVTATEGVVKWLIPARAKHKTE